MGNAGAVLRLMLGIGTLLPEVRFETDHPDSLGKRPNADLLTALRSLGIACEATEPGGLLPITLRGGPARGGAVSISGAVSSQYISALLFLGPLLRGGLDISITGELRSAGFIAATLRVLSESGIQVEAAPDLRRLRVSGSQVYLPREVAIPGDVPSAAALIAAGLARPGTPSITVAGLAADDPDGMALREALAAFGVVTSERDGGLLAEGPNGLHAATFDGDRVLDSIPVLVALACFAEGETRIAGVPTLRLKESNRIEELAAAMNAAGADVTPLSDGLLVRGKPEGIAGGAAVNSRDDHRLAQALAVAAMRSLKPITIEGAGAVAKSYPTFFTDLARLGAHVEAVAQKEPPEKITPQGAL